MTECECGCGFEIGSTQFQDLHVYGMDEDIDKLNALKKEPIWDDADDAKYEKMKCGVCHDQILGNNYITMERTITNWFGSKSYKVNTCKGCYMKEFVL